MAFSYTRLVLDETELKIYYRGLDYANSKKTTLSRVLNNACTGVVSGTKSYDVALGFSKVGSLKYSCSCPYFQENKKIICKHIIATALIWDRERKVPDPDQKTIEHLCIPEPTITRKDINKAYEDPLRADLEVLRRASDEMGWRRSHARLPLYPRICKQSFKSTLDVKKGISELRSWARRYSFDSYFCAGEMVAGFCELIRWVRKSQNSMTLEVGTDVLKLLVDYHRELIMQTIDDSDGLHEFTETHLLDLIATSTKDKDKLSPQYQKELLETIIKITDY